MCLFIYLFICMYTQTYRFFLCRICSSAVTVDLGFVDLCVYVCVYIYIYIYIHAYMYNTYRNGSSERSHYRAPRM